jgi:hypothetical protein
MTFNKGDKIVRKGANPQFWFGEVLDVWRNQHGDMHPVVVRWNSPDFNRNPVPSMYNGWHDIMLDFQIEKV